MAPTTCGQVHSDWVTVDQLTVIASPSTMRGGPKYAAVEHIDCADYIQAQMPGVWVSFVSTLNSQRQGHKEA